LIYKNDYKSLC